MWTFPKLQPKSKKIEVCVEYHSPHWVVLIKNSGHKEWTAMRSKSRMISVQDEFGIEIQKRPAIESFKDKALADQWIKDNLPECVEVVRLPSQIKSFIEGSSDQARLLKPSVRGVLS